MNGKLLVIYTTVADGMAHQVENVAQVDISYLGNMDDGFGKNADWNFISIVTKNNDKLSKQVLKLAEIMQFSVIEDKRNQ